MKKLIILALVISGCQTINVQPPAMTAGGNYTVKIEANKNVPITNTASPSGNTVPVGK